MKTYEAEGFVLRRVDYRDSDRIMTLYTREQGRLSAMARGARASRRRFAGALEPFCLIRFELAKGRTMETLRSATVLRAFPAVLTSLSRMDLAGRATGLVADLTVERAEDDALFGALVQFFEALGAVPEQELLAAFELQALALSGLAPAVDACLVSGEPRPPGTPAYFDAARGGIVRSAHLGGARSGVLALSGGALTRIEASLKNPWIPDEAWEDGEIEQVRRAIDAFRVAHVRAK
ncbi:MAG: DNA repair protein RecO [Myxococcota bacterium]